MTLDGGKQVKADAAYLEQAITDPDADVTEGYNAGLMTASIDGFDLESKPEDVKRARRVHPGREVAQRSGPRNSDSVRVTAGVAVAGANVVRTLIGSVRLWRLRPLRAFFVILIRTVALPALVTV